MAWHEEITPIEFEKLCFLKLIEFGKQEKLPQFRITHNSKVIAFDGKYQIDISASFTVFQSEVKILCECKKYNRPIEREEVVILKDKLDACKAHKGILLAVNGFQSGAIEYATQHGIALINVSDDTPPGSSGPEINLRSSFKYGIPKALQLLSQRLQFNVIVSLLTPEERAAIALERAGGEIKHKKQRKAEVEIG